eukprot:Plantae.Rhodophyta-Rhodochaete_pulchella.ctg6664.p1 GENE.Plantae.Rhodophyta-Rhodochaete_pulchella.ctg6664~~Plantae.Rhodophyta-Rhodochaete_pulchella.ctg6664.p1  ORF type:complete len:120 (-),score=9.10 Plantae.Rhodophyta-Rhodochaete_pulchella.ctg6664:189-548(-)
MRQLVYGYASDATDEYCRVSESTDKKSLFLFARMVVDKFGKMCPRRSNKEDVKTIMKTFDRVRFPGSAGVIDCASWRWEKCPKALHGVHVGKDGSPALSMVVISVDLWVSIEPLCRPAR